MKKFFLLFILFPFSLLAVTEDGKATYEDFIPSSLYVYSSLDTFTSFSVQSWDQVYQVLYCSDLIIQFNSATGTNISQPYRYLSVSTNAVNNYTRSLATPLYGPSSFHGQKYFSPLMYPPILSFYQAAVALNHAGFDGGSIRRDGKYLYFNPAKMVSEVFSSSTSEFRSILLSNLSSISTSIFSIDSSFDSFLDDYRSVNSFQLHDYSSLSNRILSLESGINVWGYNFPAATLLENINPSNYDDTEEGRLSLSSAQSSISSGLDAYEKLIGLSATLNDSQLNGNNPLSRFLRSAGEELNRSLSGSISSSSSSAASNVVNAVRMSTNWVDGVKKDLQKWSDEIKKSSISSITNSNGTLPVSGINGAPVAVSGYVQISNPNSLSVNLDGPINLSQNTINELQNHNQAIVDKLTSIQDLYDEWFRTHGTHSWVSFYDLYKSNSDDVLESLNHINSHTNYLSKLDDIYYLLKDLNFTNLAFSVSNEFHYLLLDDYDDFISNHHYSDFLEKLERSNSPYSDLLDSFEVFKHSPGSGNWWRFISANQSIIGDSVVSNTLMVSYFYSNLVSTLDFAHSNIPDGFLSQAKNVLSSFPSVEEAEYKISSVTQAVYSAAAGFSDVYSTLGNTSNQYITAVSGLYSDRSLPESISLSIIPEHPFTIPVSDMSTLWDILRLGMAFAISIVNLILLPKFVLKLFTLFFGVYDTEVRISRSEHPF